jgi:hypothetical protein
VAPVVHWPDEIDEILGGDQVVALAYATPARGVVVTPMTNFALRDRDAGALTPVNTSVGTWRKLDRIRRDPRVALAYHSRRHGFSRRPEYVLVQGTASIAPPDPDYPSSIREQWERFGGPAEFGPLWGRWLRVWRWRVGIEVAVERVTVWPNLACRGEADAYGAPPPAEPPAPQRPPRRGTGPRIDHRRAARRAERLPHVLLGWVGADGFPVVLPVGFGGTAEEGMVLEVPERLSPPGGRRAGLIAHSFARYTFGQRQRKYTGWLTVDPGARRVLYAPHTESGYVLPRSKVLFMLAAGFIARRGLRGARRAGIVPGRGQSGATGRALPDDHAA